MVNSLVWILESHFRAPSPGSVSFCANVNTFHYICIQANFSVWIIFRNRALQADCWKKTDICPCGGWKTSPGHRFFLSPLVVWECLTIVVAKHNTLWAQASWQFNSGAAIRHVETCLKTQLCLLNYQEQLGASTPQRITSNTRKH